jgi:hypothetical protein
MVEHPPCKRKAAGSSPAAGFMINCDGSCQYQRTDPEEYRRHLRILVEGKSLQDVASTLQISKHILLNLLDPKWVKENVPKEFQ